jgi:hypothetical protein
MFLNSLEIKYTIRLRGVIMSKNLLAISIFVLSLALLYNGYQLGKEHVGEKIPEQNEIPGKGLMTMEETAKYLSLNEQQFVDLINVQQKEREPLESFDTYRFIPYIEIKGEKLFNRVQLDEWIKHNSMIWEKWNG